LRRFTGDDVEVVSAGTIAADRPDPGIVAAMAEVDVDISTPPRSLGRLKL